MNSSDLYELFKVFDPTYDENVCKREWRSKSLTTVSGEYDSKANHGASKLGLALALKPRHG